MEIDFIPIDYDSFEHEGRNYAKITGRTSSEKRVCLIDKCDVYFWAILKSNVQKKEVEKIIGEIKEIRVEDSPNAKVIKTELKDKKFLGKDVKAIKIYLKSYKDIKKIAEKINFSEIDSVKEHDLSYITRYIIERGLVPLSWYKVSGEILDNSGKFGGIDSDLDVDIVLKADKISKMDSQKEFIPKVVAFDVETESFEIGKGEIIMISVVSENTKKVLTHKKIPNKQSFVELYENEKEMIRAFVEYVKKESPDILTGYFSDGFDLPYLKARAERHKIKLALGIDLSVIKFSGGMSPRGKVSGVVHVDLLKFIETAYSQYLQSETLGLNEVAGELLGEKKLEHEFKKSEKMSHSDWKTFFDYNLNDSILTYKLFMKTWHDMMEFSKVMQEPLFNVSRDGMSANVENYMIHNIFRYDEIIEQKPEHHEISQRRSREKYEGAFVLQPVPKLYENLVMFDFTSYWPSIIATFNLSRSTYLGDKKPKEGSFLEIEIGKNKLAYFSKSKGFFPEMLEDIIRKRKQYKEEYKKSPSPLLKARSNAFKLLANASYGYQGFFGARYYCPEASASATAVSRKFIHDLIKEAEKEGFKTIYGDTDSLTLELNKKSHRDAMNFLNKVNEKLPGIMELELEDFYKRGIWVTTRSGEFGAKKKYALINEQGKIKIRGFETVRRNWCNLARELQNKVLEKILKEGNEMSALEYTKQAIKKLKERKVEKKLLIIRTQLKKSLSEYKAVTPHVTIAKKMIEEGIPVNQGMLIEYYIAESQDKKSLTRDRARFPDDKKLYDIKYYLEKQILPAVENIFQVFGVNVGELIEGKRQKKLGEF